MFRCIMLCLLSLCLMPLYGLAPASKYEQIKFQLPATQAIYDYNMSTNSKVGYDQAFAGLTEGALTDTYALSRDQYTQHIRDLLNEQLDDAAWSFIVNNPSYQSALLPQYKFGGLSLQDVALTQVSDYSQMVSSWNILDYDAPFKDHLLKDILALRSNQAFCQKIVENDDLFWEVLGLRYDSVKGTFAQIQGRTTRRVDNCFAQLLGPRIMALTLWGHYRRAKSIVALIVSPKYSGLVKKDFNVDERFLRDHYWLDIIREGTRLDQYLQRKEMEAVNRSRSFDWPQEKERSKTKDAGLVVMFPYKNNIFLRFENAAARLQFFRKAEGLGLGDMLLLDPERPRTVMLKPFDGKTGCLWSSDKQDAHLCFLSGAHAQAFKELWGKESYAESTSREWVTIPIRAKWPLPKPVQNSMIQVDETQWSFVMSKNGGAMPGNIYRDRFNDGSDFLIKWGGTPHLKDPQDRYNQEGVFREVAVARVLERLNFAVPKTYLVALSDEEKPWGVASKYQSQNAWTYRDIVLMGLQDNVDYAALQRALVFAYLTYNYDFFNPENNNVLFTYNKSLHQFEPLFIDFGAYFRLQEQKKLKLHPFHNKGLGYSSLYEGLLWSQFMGGDVDYLRGHIMEGLDEEKVVRIAQDLHAAWGDLIRDGWSGLARAEDVVIGEGVDLDQVRSRFAGFKAEMEANLQEMKQVLESEQESVMLRDHQPRLHWDRWKGHLYLDFASEEDFKIVQAQLNDQFPALQWKQQRLTDKWRIVFQKQEGPVPIAGQVCLEEETLQLYMADKEDAQRFIKMILGLNDNEQTLPAWVQPSAKVGEHVPSVRLSRPLLVSYIHLNELQRDA